MLKGLAVPASGSLTDPTLLADGLAMILMSLASSGASSIPKSLQEDHLAFLISIM